MTTITMSLPLCEDNPEVEVVFDWQPEQKQGPFTEPISAYVDEIIAVYLYKRLSTKEPFADAVVSVRVNILGMLHADQVAAIEAKIMEEAGR